MDSLDTLPDPNPSEVRWGIWTDLTSWLSVRRNITPDNRTPATGPHWTMICHPVGSGWVRSGVAFIRHIGYPLPLWSVDSHATRVSLKPDLNRSISLGLSVNFRSIAVSNKFNQKIKRKKLYIIDNLTTHILTINNIHGEQQSQNLLFPKRGVGYKVIILLLLTVR